MPDSHEQPVDASDPESPIRARGTDHIAVEGTNTQDTIEYYRDLLGMSLVLSQSNLDRRHLTHLFFDTGDGRMPTFFVNDVRESIDLPDQDPGQVHHLAFRIEGEQIDDIAAALEEAGYPVTQFDRGVFHSLYTRDNSGLGVELVADKVAVRNDRRGAVLALAQRLRVDDGADFVEAEHVRAATRQLGLDVEEREVGDAPTGHDY